MTAARTATPIGSADRVSDVLARDERLLEVFIRHAVHFEKLRHPAMRRVMARLVSVEQAAQMAGVEVDVLLRDLNATLGALPLGNETSAARDAARANDAAATERCARHPADWREIELDLRADMRAGREPFARIMAAVGGLGDDHVLRLRTIFEPVPLFALLAKRGLRHESRRDAPEDWSVWFWRDVTTTAKGAPDPWAAEAEEGPRAGEVWLDVRGLEPPEPMVRTLAALETLPAGHRLVQINVRIPELLLPVLAERGYACEVDDSRADRVLVRIHKL